MTLAIVLLVVFFVCVAMMWNEGMWSNALTLVNVIFAAMVATNYFEPLADWLESQLSSYTYLFDYLSMWLLFALSVGIFRAATDAISKYRVRFRMPVEHTGRVLFAAMTGWVLVCFTCTTLHTAPLARTSFRGSFQATPKSNNFLGFAPDRLWLGFMQSRSQGALSQADQSTRSPYPADQGKRVFDPRSEFILKYAARRQKLQDYMRSSGSLLTK